MTEFRATELVLERQSAESALCVDGADAHGVDDVPRLEAGQPLHRKQLRVDEDEAGVLTCDGPLVATRRKLANNLTLETFAFVEQIARGLRGYFPSRRCGLSNPRAERVHERLPLPSAIGGASATARGEIDRRQACRIEYDAKHILDPVPGLCRFVWIRLRRVEQQGTTGRHQGGLIDTRLHCKLQHLEHFDLVVDTRPKIPVLLHLSRGTLGRVVGEIFDDVREVEQPPHAEIDVEVHEARYDRLELRFVFCQVAGSHSDVLDKLRKTRDESGSHQSRHVVAIRNVRRGAISRRAFADETLHRAIAELSESCLQVHAKTHLVIDHRESGYLGAIEIGSAFGHADACAELEMAA